MIILYHYVKIVFQILLTSPNSASFLGFLIRCKLEASRGSGPSTASKVVEQGPLRALQKEVLAAKNPADWWIILLSPQKMAMLSG